MNKINRIHLAKVPYNIEPMAEVTLNEYLKAVREAIEPDTARESMRDIEGRITEILEARSIKKDGVITAADVEAIKSRLGEPSEFGDAQPIALTPKPKSRSPLKIILVILGAAILVFAAYCAWVYMGYNHQTETQRQTYSQPVTKLSMAIDSGNISIEPAKTNEVIVERTLTWVYEKPTSKEAIQDESLTIDEGCQGHTSNWLQLGHSCSISYIIYIPQNITVDISSDSGDINIAGVINEIKAKTDAGDVSATQLVSSTVDVSTSAGNVNLQLNRPAILVKALSDAGNVTITVPTDNSYHVTAETDAGNREINVQENSTSTYKIDAKTDAGNISIKNY